MSKQTETAPYWDAIQPQRTNHAAADTQALLATATDSRAMVAMPERLGDWAIRHGHDVRRVHDEWMAGNLWPKRRMNDGRLSCDYVEKLQREAAMQGGLLNNDTEVTNDG